MHSLLCALCTLHSSSLQSELKCHIFRLRMTGKCNTPTFAQKCLTSKNLQQSIRALKVHLCRCLSISSRKHKHKHNHYKKETHLKTQTPQLIDFDRLQYTDYRLVWCARGSAGYYLHLRWANLNTELHYLS
jgi:hypothetical protein